jgi:hypothetical protein
MNARQLALVQYARTIAGELRGARTAEEIGGRIMACMWEDVRALGTNLLEGALVAGEGVARGLAQEGVTAGFDWLRSKLAPKQKTIKQRKRK